MERPSCPECNAEDVHKLGFIILRRGKVQRWQCKLCGRTFLEKRKED